MTVTASDVIRVPVYLKNASELAKVTGADGYIGAFQFNVHYDENLALTGFESELLAPLDPFLNNSKTTVFGFNMGQSNLVSLADISDDVPIGYLVFNTGSVAAVTEVSLSIVALTDDYISTDDISVHYSPYVVTESGTVTIETVPVVEKFNIVSISNVMGNELALYFYVNQSDLEGTDYYAEIVMQNADGSTTEATVPFAKWEVNNAYYRFRFDGIAAKQMADEITVIVYNGDGSVASNTRVTSMRDYTMRALDAYAAYPETCTMLVDMLNYGAAAQSYFGYNAEDPANNQLTKAQQAMATQSVELANNRVVGANYSGVSLTYANKILLTLYFKDVTEGMYAEVVFTDHYGRKQTDTVYYDEFETRSNLKGVIADELAVADFRSVVKCTVYNADGTVHGYCEDSAETYAATMGANDPLFQAAAKFSQSAYNYFH